MKVSKELVLKLSKEKQSALLEILLDLAQEASEAQHSAVLKALRKVGTRTVVTYVELKTGRLFLPNFHYQVAPLSVQRVLMGNLFSGWHSAKGCYITGRAYKCLTGRIFHSEKFVTSKSIFFMNKNSPKFHFFF